MPSIKEMILGAEVNLEPIQEKTFSVIERGMEENQERIRKALELAKQEERKFEDKDFKGLEQAQKIVGLGSTYAGSILEEADEKASQINEHLGEEVGNDITNFLEGALSINEFAEEMQETGEETVQCFNSLVQDTVSEINSATSWMEDSLDTFADVEVDLIGVPSPSIEPMDLVAAQ